MRVLISNHDADCDPDSDPDPANHKDNPPGLRGSGSPEWRSLSGPYGRRPWVYLAPNMPH